MQATIKIDVSELDYRFFKKLKNLFKNETIEISINTDAKSSPKESKEEYFNRINSALERISKNENTIEFTSENFDELVKEYSIGQK